jgi:hypothetical protein
MKQIYLFFFLSILVLSCQSDVEKGVKQNTAEDTTAITDEKTAVPQNPTTGTISGLMSYPNGPFPRDLTVVIRDVNTGNIYSSRKWDKNSGQYSVEVAAPATYEVYALTGLHQGYKAYYSDYVVCGMQTGCNSHKRVLVDVKPGETVNNINPQDWYIP